MTPEGWTKAKIRNSLNSSNNNAKKANTSTTLIYSEPYGGSIIGRWNMMAAYMIHM